MWTDIDRRMRNNFVNTSLVATSGSSPQQMAQLRFVPSWERNSCIFTFHMLQIFAEKSMSISHQSSHAWVFCALAIFSIYVSFCGKGGHGSGFKGGHRSGFILYHYKGILHCAPSNRIVAASNPSVLMHFVAAAAAATNPKISEEVVARNFLRFSLPCNDLDFGRVLLSKEVGKQSSKLRMKCNAVTIHHIIIHHITRQTSHNNTLHNNTSHNKTSHNNTSHNNTSYNNTWLNSTSQNNTSQNHTSHNNTSHNNTLHNNTFTRQYITSQYIT